MDVDRCHKDVTIAGERYNQYQTRDVAILL